MPFTGYHPTAKALGFSPLVGYKKTTSVGKLVVWLYVAIIHGYYFNLI